jgi:hypothetical protein
VRNERWFSIWIGSVLYRVVFAYKYDEGITIRIEGKGEYRK